MQPTELLAIIAAAKKETAKAVKDALPTIADMVRREVDAKEVRTIADVAVTLKGDKGDKGDQGEIGPQGETGPKGDKGDQGQQGIQGPKGDAGINGVDGRDGIDGKNGLSGRNGANGKDGVGVAEVAIGDDGHLYVALDNGRVIDAGVARGRDGKDGKAGAIVYGGGGSSGGSGSGSQGPAGADGASAYDVAVANGFSGTESEWLDSLIGATGPQGPQGPQGIQGVKGDTGDTGPAGPAGATGPQGPQGETGATGPAGADGAPGAGLPIGGTAGQIPVKSSGVDYAVEWGSVFRGLSLPLKPVAGVIIGPATSGAALGTVAQVANRNTIAPFVAAFDLTIDQVGISVSTGVAGSTAKVVIYNADADGRPTTVVAESGTIDCATSSTTLFTALNVSFVAGRIYWIGVRSSANQTLRSLPAAAFPVLSYTSAATPVIQTTLAKTETYGNAASTWTYLSTHHSNLTVPLVLMRVA